MKIRILGILLILSATLITCRNDDDVVPVDDDMMPMDSLPAWGSLENHIFVLNEGSFGASNGSLTAINRDTALIWQGIFDLVNEFQLGDIVQSMTIHEDKAYIVVNNSGKIEIADANTLESIATIEGLSAPRYFLPVNEDKAYVTNFIFEGSTTLDIIDLDTYTVIKTIPTGWGEQMVMADGKVFVGIMNSYDVLVIDPETDEVLQTLSVNYAPNSLKVDKNGKVWVLSDGSYSGEYTPALQRINPVTLQMEQVLTFTMAATPEKLAINKEGDRLYYLEAGKVWSLGIEDTALPAEVFISEEGVSFYGLGIDPVTDDIYVTDADDFVSKGSVLYYKNDGTRIGDFVAGVVPGGFLFAEN